MLKVLKRWRHWSIITDHEKSDLQKVEQRKVNCGFINLIGILLEQSNFEALTTGKYIYKATSSAIFIYTLFTKWDFHKSDCCLETIFNMYPLVYLRLQIQTDSVGFKIIGLVFRKQTVHGHGIRTWHRNFGRRMYFTLREQVKLWVHMIFYMISYTSWCE